MLSLQKWKAWAYGEILRNVVVSNFQALALHPVLNWPKLDIGILWSTEEAGLGIQAQDNYN